MSPLSALSRYAAYEDVPAVMAADSEQRIDAADRPLAIGQAEGASEADEEDDGEVVFYGLEPGITYEMGPLVYSGPSHLFPYWRPGRP